MANKAVGRHALCLSSYMYLAEHPEEDRNIPDHRAEGAYRYTREGEEEE